MTENCIGREAMFTKNKVLDRHPRQPFFSCFHIPPKWFLISSCCSILFGWSTQLGGLPWAHLLSWASIVLPSHTHGTLAPLMMRGHTCYSRGPLKNLTGPSFTRKFSVLLILRCIKGLIISSTLVKFGPACSRIPGLLLVVVHHVA